MTGAPGVGKTTVLIKVVEALKAKGVSVGGMVSREVRGCGGRVGFEVLDIAGGGYGWLAHVNLKDGPSVGKYRVCLRDLDEVGVASIEAALWQCAVVAIDEVGPMELFSMRFKEAVTRVLESQKLVLAVVHAKARDPLIDAAKNRADTEIFTVTPANRDRLPKELTATLLRSLSKELS